MGVSSVLPAAPEEIWSRIVLFETLRYIAAPYAHFSVIGADNELVWREGETTQFRL